MGVIKQVIIRGVLRLVTIMLSVISGIVVARRLDPRDYSLYQVITKRVDMYAGLPGVVAGFWAYRYAALGVRGVAKAFMIAVLLSGALAFSVAIGLTLYMGFKSPTLLLLAGVSSLLWSFFARYSLYVVSLRPIYSELSITVRRGVYAATVLLLVYLVHLGLYGALASFALSSAIGIALALRGTWRWLREPMCRRCLTEWLRGAYVPVITWVSTLVAALDVVIVTALGDGYAVAAFFASTVALRMLIEILNASLQHLAAYILRTRDEAAGLTIARLAGFVGAVVVGYAAVRPRAIIALMNPLYVPAASTALRIYAFSTLITIATQPLLQLILGVDRSTATKPGRGVKGSAYVNLASSLTYILALGAGTYIAPDANLVELWAVASVLRSTTAMLGMLVVANSPTRALFLSSVLPYTALHTVVSCLVAVLLTQGGYEETFVANAVLLLRNLTAQLLACLVIGVAVDRVVRDFAVKTVRRIAKPLK